MPTSRETSAAISCARSASPAAIARHASGAVGHGDLRPRLEALRARRPRRGRRRRRVPSGTRPITCSVVESITSITPSPQRVDPLAADVELLPDDRRAVVAELREDRRLRFARLPCRISSSSPRRPRRCVDAGAGDRLGRPVRERHDRDHRVGAGARRERAAVADPHARRVVQLAPRVRHRRRGIGAHPARAHLVRGEQLRSAGAQRHAAAALDERLEVVADPPHRQAVRERRRSAARPPRGGAGRRPRARAEVLDVERVARPSSTAPPRRSRRSSTRPCPRSRMSAMNDAPRRAPAIISLCSSALVHGIAEPVRPGVYCAPSIRKP